MRSILSKVLLSASLGLLLQPASAATVLVFGDSLSAGYGLSPGQGWVSLLAKEMGAKHRIINASISGETTAGRLARRRTRWRAIAPTSWCWAGRQRRPARPAAGADARQSVQDDRLGQTKQGQGAAGGHGPAPNYGPQYGAEFRNAYAELAKRERLPFVPLLVAGFEADLSKFQPDGLHPIAAAQPQMMRTVKAKLPLN